MDKKIKIYTMGILITLAIVLIILYHSPDTSLTGKVIFEPATPVNCLTSNVSSVWDTIFRESSSGITTVFNDTLETADKCDNYLAYKLINNEELYLLQGIEGNNSYKKILGIHGNFTPAYINYIKAITSAEISKFDIEIVVPNENITGIRNLSSAPEANATFNNTFKITSSTWGADIDAGYITYYFEEETTIDNNKTEVEGIIFGNRTFDYYGFLKQPLSACTPNWTKQFTTCTSNEQKTEYYTDSNNCGVLTSKPGNETLACDYNNNNIMGNTADIDDTRVNLSIEIDDDLLNQSEVYEDELDVKILDGNLIIAQFDWDFDTPLNLFDIEIEKQSSSSSFGYLIVEGIDAEKIIKVNKLNSSSTSVCVKDSSVSSINSISDDCSETDEYLIPCPGSNGFYGCSISSGMFVISGVEHSAAMEYTGDYTLTTNAICSPNWNCSAWTNCTNNLRTRVCTDKNSCNNNSAKPNVSETCVGVCAPNWNCTEWSPKECPSKETQTRTCTDLKSCGILSGKPATSKSCTYEGGHATTILIIIIVILILLGIIGVILFIYFKRGGESSQETTNRTYPPSIPPSTTYPTMQRIPVMPPNSQVPGTFPQNPPRRKWI